MRNCFWNSPDNSKDFGNVKVAPIDSGASRRSFLKALAVAGASAALPSSGLLGQTTPGVSRIVPGRIDVHHHMFPAVLREGHGGRDEGGRIYSETLDSGHFARHDG